MSTVSSRLSHLQREGEAPPRGPSGGYLQLRPASLYPHVLGEGGRQEPTRGLPVRQVQVHHQPGRRRRRHSPGPAGGHAAAGAAGGRAGHFATTAGHQRALPATNGAGAREQRGPSASTGLRGPQPAGSGQPGPGGSRPSTRQPAAAAWRQQPCSDHLPLRAGPRLTLTVCMRTDPTPPPPFSAAAIT